MSIRASACRLRIRRLGALSTNLADEGAFTWTRTASADGTADPNRYGAAGFEFDRNAARNLTEPARDHRRVDSREVVEQVGDEVQGAGLVGFATGGLRGPAIAVFGRCSILSRSSRRRPVVPLIQSSANDLGLIERNCL